MQSKLYVGNLSYNATEEELRKLFEPFGQIQSINIITDRFTGQSKGFAFVEMSSGEEAEKALQLEGTDFLGRHLHISEAKPQEPRGRSGGFRDGKSSGGHFHRGKRGDRRQGGGGGGQKK